VFFMGKRHLTMMMEKRVYLVLVLSAIFVLVNFTVKGFRDNVLWFLYPFLVVLILLYFKSKRKEEKYDRILLMIILSAFILSRVIFQNPRISTITLRTAAVMAFTLLNCVLLIGPMSRFFPAIRRFYFYRRHLGIATFFMASLHISIVFSDYFNYSFDTALRSPVVFYGMTAYFLMFWMAVTSFDYLQKYVKSIHWKVLHGVLFILYLGLIRKFYVILQESNNPLMGMHLALVVFIVLYWLTAAPYSVMNKIMKTHVFGWKQLHVMIHVIYLCLLFHVWIGVVIRQSLPVKMVFLLSPLLVYGSHGYGWITRALQDNKIYSTIKKIDRSITKDGRVFLGLDMLSNFVEGKGRKFYINKKPVAVFKRGAEVLAFSNVCCHQKGPLFQGRLCGDTVECPWHYYVYNIHTGNFLGKEPFCIPKHSALVEDGIVFVSTDVVNKERVHYP